MPAGPPSTARNSPENPQPLSAVVDQVKGWVERCGWIWVQGQVIELRRRAAPTQFLTLRDSRSDHSAKLTCSSTVLDAAGPLTEGMTVLACLTPRVWSKDASLSFECAEPCKGEKRAEHRQRHRKARPQTFPDNRQAGEPDGTRGGRRQVAFPVVRPVRSFCHRAFPRRCRLCRSDHFRGELGRR